MPQRRATVATATGMHARPAALFTQQAASSGYPIRVAKDGQQPVDATSILMVMSLRLAHGDEIVLASEDDAAQAALDELAKLIETDLDSVAVQP